MACNPREPCPPSVDPTEQDDIRSRLDAREREPLAVRHRAQAVPGVKVKKLAFPDVPGPGSAEMMAWLRPDAPKILDAGIQMMRA